MHPETRISGSPAMKDVGMYVHKRTAISPQTTALPVCVRFYHVEIEALVESGNTQESNAHPESEVVD